VGTTAKLQKLGRRMENKGILFVNLYHFGYKFMKVVDSNFFHMIV